MKSALLSLMLVASWVASCAHGPRVVFKPSNAWDEKGPGFACYREGSQLVCLDLKDFMEYINAAADAAEEAPADLSAHQREL